MTSLLDWLSRYRYSNYTVRSDIEDVFTVYHRLIGVISLSVNSLHLYLIVQSSQLYTRGYRFSLFLLQVWFIALNLHLSLLSIPFPLYPLFGAYSRGFLGTHLHVSFHYQMIILIFIVDECIASLLMTALFRNQSLIMGGKFKLNNVQLVIVILLLHAALVTNAIIFVFIDLNREDQLILLTTRYPGLSWISSHGFVWAAYAWNGGAFFFLLSIFLQCVIIGTFAALVVRYTIVTVRRQRKIIAKRNDARLTRKVRRVDILVIAQMTTAILLMLLPLLTIGICLFGYLPYYVSWTALACMATHSFVNSCVIILLNPKYLDHLRERMSYLIERRAHSQRRVGKSSTRTNTSVVPILVLTTVT